MARHHSGKLQLEQSQCQPPCHHPMRNPRGAPGKHSLKLSGTQFLFRESRAASMAILSLKL